MTLHNLINSYCLIQIIKIYEIWFHNTVLREQIRISQFTLHHWFNFLFQNVNRLYFRILKRYVFEFLLFRCFWWNPKACHVGIFLFSFRGDRFSEIKVPHDIIGWLVTIKEFDYLSESRLLFWFIYLEVFQSEIKTRYDLLSFVWWIHCTSL